jgi:hypothetical protein
MKPTSFLVAFACLAGTVTALPGCGSDKEYVRGANDPSIDNAAMSTGLDKDDVQRALHTLLDHMRSAPIMTTWRNNGGNSKVAVAPFRNETSEHIDSQLQALLGESETWLVNSGTVTMISQERQLDMIRETERTQHPVFEPGLRSRADPQVRQAARRRVLRHRQGAGRGRAHARRAARAVLALHAGHRGRDQRHSLAAKGRDHQDGAVRSPPCRAVSVSFCPSPRR